MTTLTAGDLDTVIHLEWPAEEARRRRLAEAGVPRLLHVAPGAPPPTVTGPEEDWVREPAGAGDVRLREATLRRRDPRAGGVVRRPQRVEVDEDGLVRRDGRWVALSEVEAAMARSLLDGAGHCVPRTALLAAAFPDEDRELRSVDTAVRRVRRKLTVLGIAIHGIAGSGYLAEVIHGPMW